MCWILVCQMSLSCPSVLCLLGRPSFLWCFSGEFRHFWGRNTRPAPLLSLLFVSSRRPPSCKPDTLPDAPRRRALARSSKNHRGSHRPISRDRHSPIRDSRIRDSRIRDSHWVTYRSRCSSAQSCPSIENNLRPRREPGKYSICQLRFPRCIWRFEIKPTKITLLSFCGFRTPAYSRFRAR